MQSNKRARPCRTLSCRNPSWIGKKDVFTGIGKFEGEYTHSGRVWKRNLFDWQLMACLHLSQSRHPGCQLWWCLERRTVVSESAWIPKTSTKSSNALTTPAYDRGGGHPPGQSKGLHGPRRQMWILACKAGWPVQLQYLTTFNTPLGRYRCLRMPFGLNSAPEIWQRKMHGRPQSQPAGTRGMLPFHCRARPNWRHTCSTQLPWGHSQRNSERPWPAAADSSHQSRLAREAEGNSSCCVSPLHPEWTVVQGRSSVPGRQRCGASITAQSHAWENSLHAFGSRNMPATGSWDFLLAMHELRDKGLRGEVWHMQHLQAGAVQRTFEVTWTANQTLGEGRDWHFHVWPEGVPTNCQLLLQILGS